MAGVSMQGMGPCGFLAQFGQGAVLDETQRVPALLSWIQSRVDEHPGPCKFIRTGRHSFHLVSGITQSLAASPAQLNSPPIL